MGATSPHPMVGPRIMPGEMPGDEQEPRRGVRLHHIGRCSPGVGRRDTDHADLHGAEGRNPHLNQLAGVLLLEPRQAGAHGGRKMSTGEGKRGRQRGADQTLLGP